MGLKRGVPRAARCPSTATLTARPCSPAGDVAHHRDAKFGIEVDAIGDASGDDDLGEDGWSEGGPSCTGTMVEEEEEGTHALELHSPRHFIPPFSTLEGTGPPVAGVASWGGHEELGQLWVP